MPTDIGMNQHFASRVLSTTTNPGFGSSLGGNTGGYLAGGSAGGQAGIVASMQAAQDAANAANQKRYKQGLGVLTDAKNQALAANQQVGQTQLRQIGQDETQGLAQADQNAVSRGLGNTTIRSALQSQVKRRANDARQAANEGVANRTSQLTLQASNPIADAIFARNDNGPDTGNAASILAAIAAGRARFGG